ncbi:MAG: iron-sulfur cluster assembly accessory protein [Fimbriimonadaceae bacterium]|jgi:iron-sulfur cluster assembly protein|nr:iron-sulfur cluster assembly accessory protein [Fimbriimonadaceae bacterium]
MKNTQFPVEVAPEAWEQIHRLLQRKGESGSFLRIGVKGGGCSGLEYVFRLDTKELPIDTFLEQDGIKIACDEKSAQYLLGAKLVYTGNLMGGGFAFENPNAQRNCGCGTSFTPKPKS